MYKFHTSFLYYDQTILTQKVCLSQKQLRVFNLADTSTKL